MKSNTKFSPSAELSMGGGKPNNHLNRIIKKSNLFIIVTILFLLLTGVAAADPIEIYNLNDLMDINNNSTSLSANYILMDYIDVGAQEIPGTLVFRPIGNATDPFRGNFDGGSYTISNITYSNNVDYVGFFGFMDGSNVSNLFLEDVTFGGRNSVGGLVGQPSNSNISNVHVTGHVDIIGTTNPGNIGGMAGQMYNTRIRNSSAAVEVMHGTSIAANNVGGFVGSMSGSSIITYSSATGNLRGADYVGGFAGRVIDSTISNSSATGDVEGTNHVGGFVGQFPTSGFIVDSSAAGSVSGVQNTGGFAGSVFGVAVNRISNSYASGDVSGGMNTGGFVGNLSQSFIANSYASGDVSGSSQRTGGFAGLLTSNSRLSHCYATGNATGTTGVGGLIGQLDSGSNSINSFYIGTPNSGPGMRVTPSELMTYLTFTPAGGYVTTAWSMSTTLNSNSIWYLDEGNAYPKFFWDSGYTVTFDSNGGTTVPSQRVNPGSVATEPPNPNKAGHTFVEWQRVVGGNPSGTPYNFATDVHSNLTLIAIYDTITHTVTFKDDDGTTLHTEIVNHNDVVARPSSDPVKVGHSFDEWQSGGSTYVFTTPVTSSFDIDATYTVNTGSYTVTFKDDDGTTLHTETVNHNDVVARPSADPVKAGHDFDEWQVGGLTYVFTTPVTSSFDIDATYTLGGGGSTGGGGTGGATIVDNTPNEYTPQDNEEQNNEEQNNEQQNNTPIDSTGLENPKSFPWALLLIGALLSIFIFFFILFKRRKDEEEEES